jgi:hypothetical protein
MNLEGVLQETLQFPQDYSENHIFQSYMQKNEAACKRRNELTKLIMYESGLANDEMN